MRVNTRHINPTSGTASVFFFFGWSFSGYTEDVPLVELLYLVFTRMPGESYRRRLGSLLLYLVLYIFQALINSLVC